MISDLLDTDFKTTVLNMLRHTQTDLRTGHVKISSLKSKKRKKRKRKEEEKADVNRGQGLMTPSSHLI